MSEAIEFIQNNISAFDLVVFLITIYSMAQCAAKGFMMSLLSFSKWLLALIITIILVPKLNPWVQDYIESKRNLLLDNGITRLLLGPRYVFDTPFGTINKKHYSMALDNLDKYFVVAGITERYNESLLVLKNELQWNSPFYSIANKSKKNNELFDLNTNDQIMQCYYYDLKIYNYVNKMLDNKINSILNFLYIYI